jgi:hypothetical protein
MGPHNFLQADKTMIVRQAANVLEILEYFAKRLRPATAAELAEDLGWPRSSTFKIVATLASKGYLYEPRGRGGYYPSPRWLVLAEAVTQADPLPEKYQRLVRDLMQATGETVAIAAPAGIHATFVDVAESLQPVRYFAAVGDRVQKPSRRGSTRPRESAGTRAIRSLPPTWLVSRCRCPVATGCCRSLWSARYRAASIGGPNWRRSPQSI